MNSNIKISCFNNIRNTYYYANNARNGVAMLQVTYFVATTVAPSVFILIVIHYINQFAKYIIPTAWLASYVHTGIYSYMVSRCQAVLRPGEVDLQLIVSTFLRSM